MIANASVIVNASHADGQVEFNITTFDLAGNSLTVTQTNLNSSKSYNRSHKSNYLKSNHIQQQRPQHLTCNLG